MPIYEYTFTHSLGAGNGSIEADSADDARNKLTAAMQPTKKGVEKLKNLKFDITETEQPVED